MQLDDSSLDILFCEARTHNGWLDKEFFPDGKVKSNFVVNLCYGDPAKLFPRNPRLAFEEAAQIL
jgi:3-hydroxypropanoate dehydrogenase